MVKCKKLALMDKNLNIITEFEAVNYTYKRSGGVSACFYTYKKDGNYYIETHPSEDNFEIVKNYVVNENGKIIQ